VTTQTAAVPSCESNSELEQILGACRDEGGRLRLPNPEDFQRLLHMKGANHGLRNVCIPQGYKNQVTLSVKGETFIFEHVSPTELALL